MCCEMACDEMACASQTALQFLLLKFLQFLTERLQNMVSTQLVQYNEYSMVYDDEMCHV